MCGIVGVLGECSPELFSRMVQKISHRGPDHFAMESYENVHLGHTRLSIIDLSVKSNQPLWDAKQQACIVFNGEIYNYRTLRQSLIELGYVFNSEGDAEVILNLYLQYGPSCLEQLSGIFAFAIWDRRAEELFVARDPYGVKPLYYVENKNGFYFSSEVKALLEHPSVSRELNMDAILRTIVFLWSPGPETILKDVLKLEPGHYLVVKNQKVTKKVQYYTLPVYTGKLSSVSLAVQEINDALYASVSEQLISDVPVGAFLSGGLDSSLIVAMAKKAGADALQCFTIDSMELEDEKRDGFVSDLPYAKQVAKDLNFPLDVLKVKPDVVRLLSKMIYHLDEPQADPAPLNVMLICEEARKKGIKVLFSGTGGDDIFTGYRRHIALKYEKYWSWLPKFLRIQLEKSSRSLRKNNSIFRRISKLFYYAGLPETERLLSYFYWIDPSVARNLFAEKSKIQLNQHPMQVILDEINARSEKSKLEKMLYIERRYFLTDHNFNYTDKMSMAEGVEVRVPFLDKRLLELASQINDSLKQRFNIGKWILKKAATAYLPHAIVFRKKSGFGAPLKRWLTTDLKPIMNELLSDESLEKRGLFKPEAVRELIEKNNKGKEYYDYPIFALLCVELWCRIFIDGCENKDIAPDVSGEIVLPSEYENHTQDVALS